MASSFSGLSGISIVDLHKQTVKNNSCIATSSALSRPSGTSGSTKPTGTSAPSTPTAPSKPSRTTFPSEEIVTSGSVTAKTRRTPSRTPSRLSSRASSWTPQRGGGPTNSISFFGDVNPGCFVAVVEGRGSARGEVGIASISLSNPTLVLCQFSDTRTYVRTLTKMAVFNPAEILVPTPDGAFGASDSSLNKLYDDICEQFPSANVNQIHRKYFSESRGLQTVKHLCAAEYNSVELQLKHKYYALSAAYCLLKYVEFVQSIIYAPKSLKVEFQASTDSTMVDAETAKHVELLASSLKKNSDKSLFGILNRCSTPGGIKLLRAHLFQPPTKVDDINDRLDAVEELIARPEVLSGLQASLSRFVDLDKVLSLCAVLPKQDTLHTVEQRINQILALKQCLSLVPNLLTTLSADVTSKQLLKIKDTLAYPSYPEMLEKINRVISDDAKIGKEAGAMRLQRCFAVRAGLNGLLDVARRTYCEIVDDIEVIVRQLTAQYSIPFMVGFNGHRGYHVKMNRPSTAANGGKKFKLTDLPKEFLHPQQFRGVISFSTEALVKADQQSQNVLREITLLSNVIVQELVSELRNTVGSIFKLSEAISTLDMLVSFADVSAADDYVRPTFSDKLQIVGSRHPILERLETVSDVVANDVLAAPGDSNFHVLFGPNMSGKSTYLKQIILLQIMAQVGCFVPAAKNSLPVFRVADTIFSRVGTADSIECNASTFAVEMRETAYILNNIGNSSLIVIDELGRGTSCEEGAALCWAISEKLAGSKAFTFLATHYQLLLKLESAVPGVVTHTFLTELRENDASLEENANGGCGGDIMHTHKLSRGHHIIDDVANYGLLLAKKLNMPPVIIKRSFEIVQQLKTNEKVMPDVNAQDLRKLNSFRVCQTLCKVAKRDDMDDDTKVETMKMIQRQFLGNLNTTNAATEIESEDDVSFGSDLE